MRAGQWLAVHGCGGVGLSAVMIGVALGARVVAVDVSPAALDRAKALGAEVVVDAAQDLDPAATIREVTGGGASGLDRRPGLPGHGRGAVRSLRRRGRHVQVGLLLGAAASTPLPMDVVTAWELEIYGSHGMAAHEYPPMLALIESGALRPDLLVGQTIALDGAGAALAAMDRSPTSAGMTVIELSGEKIGGG